MSNFTRHCPVGRRNSLSACDVRAWRRTINHLDELGLTALGRPLGVLMQLYAISDDELVRALDTIWDTVS